MNDESDEKGERAPAKRPGGSTEPRCDECQRPIPAGIPAVWDVPLSAMFCSPPCRWRYREKQAR